MAEVFLARTVGAAGFSRPVAIKRILAGYSEDPVFAERFVTEARLTARLRHPNIVSVLDFDKDSEKRLFLVMELVDGADLSQLAQTGPLPVSVILYVITEVLRGLQYAHDLPDSGDKVRGVIHRDVSPHNVLLSWEGGVFVSDFGVAKARDASRAAASMMVVGKPCYMSPEQINGQPLDGTSDLFAVGIMMWELLCGRMLFEGETFQATCARVVFAPIPTPREHCPHLSRELEQITIRLLEREHSQRYPNASAVIDELLACPEYPRNGRKDLATLLAERLPARPRIGLGEVASGLPARSGADSLPTVMERPGGGVAAAAVPMTAAPQTPVAAAPPPRVSRRRTRSWVLLVLLAVATALGTAGVLAGVLHRSPDHSTPPSPPLGSDAVAPSRAGPSSPSSETAGAPTENRPSQGNEVPLDEAGPAPDTAANHETHKPAGSNAPQQNLRGTSEDAAKAPSSPRPKRQQHGRPPGIKEIQLGVSPHTP